MLTATRSGEVRGALWEEFDVDERQWCIAAERTKANAKHVVPLSRPALDLLERARPLGRGSARVPRPPGGPKSR